MAIRCSRIGQNVFIGAVAGSVFSNIAPTDTATMSGFLFFTALYGALGSFAVIPATFEQKRVYYKHFSSLFYPTSALVIAQAVVVYPLHVIESIIFCTIM